MIRYFYNWGDNLDSNMIFVYILIGLMVLFLEIGFASKEKNFTGLILPITFLMVALYNYLSVGLTGTEFTEDVIVLITIGIEGFIVSIIVFLLVRMRKKGGK